jgi:hypothetical protein
MSPSQELVAAVAALNTEKFIQPHVFSGFLPLLAGVVVIFFYRLSLLA